MNKKRVLYILLGMLLLFIVIATIYLSAFIQPKIDFTAEINTVSNEDYTRILNNAQVMYPNKDIERFKHINIEIKVTAPLGVRNNIKIERDILQQYLKDNKKIQILGGGSLEYGNGKEYAENIEIYLIDLSVDELRNELEDFRYKVTWKDIWDRPNDKVFYLRDYLKLK
ncbi:hypothetical protein [Candidatus Clostridium stratigraminis]|uniref:Uncharacterized protein n=1 Tax=Candidatus Clostridium stratigraminis TaxID=3381661 RepID=A0ABW8SZU5_9CLOT